MRIRYKHNSYYDDIESLKDTNNCALVAISFIFKMRYSFVRCVFKVYGRKNKEGASITQIKKVLKSFNRVFHATPTYKKIKGKKPINEFAESHNKGVYLVVIKTKSKKEHHAIVIKNGVVYDEKFRIKFNKEKELNQAVLDCYWKIDIDLFAV